MIFDWLARKTTSVRTVTEERLIELMRQGGASAAGIDVSASRAMMLATVAAIVRVLSESCGQLPLHWFEQKGEQRLKATGHSLYPLLHDGPNSYQTTQEWVEWMVACLALRGNSYCRIVRRFPGGPVIELLPIHPDAVTVKRTDGVITYDVRQADGTTKTFTADEIFHVKLMSLDGGLTGASPLAMARESIGMAIASEQHGAGLFKHGARPWMAFKTDKGLSPTALANIEKSIREKYAGSENHGKTMLLEEGLTPAPLGMLSTDAQWLEGRRFTREELCGIWRTPPHLVADLSRATFGNIEEQGLNFVVHGLAPYLTRIEGRIRFQLLQPEERGRFFAKFNMGGLLRGDMAARGQFYVQLQQCGAISPNEIRELEDRNPREGGDSFLSPANMLIDGKLPEALTPAPKPPAKAGASAA